jgi:transposase
MANARLPVVLHLPPEEIGRRYRSCRSGVEKTHWQVLWLLTRPDRPFSPAQAAQQVGLSAVWARQILKRWNAQGPDGLVDRRVEANGGQSKLTPEQHIDLWAALRKSPPDGGLWTGTKVAAFVLQRWGVRVCKQTGWEWLSGLGFSLQVPRPIHPEAATPAARRAWKRRPGCPDGRAASPAPRPGRRALGRG